MEAMSPEVCTNCEEPIHHTPVYFDGRAYCCVGCVAGGPCLCTYEEPGTPTREVARAPRTAVSPRHAPAASTVPAPAAAARPATRPVQPAVRAPQAAPAPASRPAAASTPRSAVYGFEDLDGAETTEPDTRTPIPFRRPGELTIAVQASGFTEQRQVLTFAAAMESATAFSEVSLTRITDSEAWFAVRATSVADVAAALEAFRGFTILTTIDQNLVQAHVAPAAATRPMQPAEHGGDSLLPQRPRFRVFRPAEGATPAPPRDVPAMPAAAAQAPAAAMPGTAVPPRSLSAQPATAAPPAAPRAPQTSNGASSTARATASAPRPPLAPGAAATAQAAAAPVAPPPRTEAAAPVRRTPRDDDEYVNPDERPGGAVQTSEHLTLVVYPFHSFAALNEFQSAVKKLHGVKATRVRRFYRGTLHLAVDYEDVIPLSDRLADLDEFSFEVVSESRAEVEIVLQDLSSLVASGEG